MPCPQFPVHSVLPPASRPQFPIPSNFGVLNTVDSGQGTVGKEVGGRELETGTWGRELRTGHWGQGVWDRELGAGNWGQQTGDRELGTGNCGWKSAQNRPHSSQTCAVVQISCCHCGELFAGVSEEHELDVQVWRLSCVHCAGASFFVRSTVFCAVPLGLAFGELYFWCTVVQIRCCHCGELFAGVSDEHEYSNRIQAKRVRWCK